MNEENKQNVKSGQSSGAVGSQPGQNTNPNADTPGQNPQITPPQVATPAQNPAPRIVQPNNATINNPQVEHPTNPPVSPQPTAQQPFQQNPTQQPTGGQTLNSAGVPPSRKSFFGGKKTLVAILIAVLVLGGGAAAYMNFFSNSPENIWKRALGNTASGLDKFVELSAQDQKGYKIDGNFSVSGPLSADGSVSGRLNSENNSAELDMELGVAGARFKGELVADGNNATNSPDLYFRVDGLKGITSLIGSLGASPELSDLLGELNNQWYVVDRTLISSIGGSQATQLTLTPEETQQLASEFSQVMRNTVFSADDDKAVFVIDEKIGNEEFEGTASYKFKVKVNKENLKKFATAIKDVVKQSKLNEVFTEGQDISLEEVINFEDLIESIEDSNLDDFYAHVWVEENGMFVRNVRFYPEQGNETSNYLDFMLNYTGGDVFPFVMRATIDDDNISGTVEFGLEINHTNADTKSTFNLDLDSGEAKFTGGGELSVSSSDEDFTVTPPSGAKDIFELISKFTSLSGSSSSGAPSTITPLDTGILGDFDSL